MKKYEVIINGTNYLSIVDGSPKKIGFYVTRYVEALNPDQAEKKGIELIRNDPSVSELSCNLPDDLPIIALEEMYEIESFDGLETLNPGFGFYNEDD